MSGTTVSDRWRKSNSTLEHDLTSFGTLDERIRMMRLMEKMGELGVVERMCDATSRPRRGTFVSYRIESTETCCREDD